MFQVKESCSSKFRFQAAPGLSKRGLSFIRLTAFPILLASTETYFNRETHLNDLCVLGDERNDVLMCESKMKPRANFAGGSIKRIRNRPRNILTNQKIRRNKSLRALVSVNQTSRTVRSQAGGISLQSDRTLAPIGASRNLNDEIPFSMEDLVSELRGLGLFHRNLNDEIPFSMEDLVTELEGLLSHRTVNDGISFSMKNMLTELVGLLGLSHRYRDLPQTVRLDRLKEFVSTPQHQQCFEALGNEACFALLEHTMETYNGILEGAVLIKSNPRLFCWCSDSAFSSTLTALLFHMPANLSSEELKASIEIIQIFHEYLHVTGKINDFRNGVNLLDRWMRVLLKRAEAVSVESLHKMKSVAETCNQIRGDCENRLLQNLFVSDAQV